MNKSQEDNSKDSRKPGASINFSDETWRRFFVMALLAGGACSYRDVIKHAGDVLKILGETKAKKQ